MHDLVLLDPGHPGVGCQPQRVGLAHPGREPGQGLGVDGAERAVVRAGQDAGALLGAGLPGRPVLPARRRGVFQHDDVAAWDRGARAGAEDPGGRGGERRHGEADEHGDQRQGGGSRRGSGDRCGEHALSPVVDVGADAAHARTRSIPFQPLEQDGTRIGRVPAAPLCAASALAQEEDLPMVRASRSLLVVTAVLVLAAAVVPGSTAASAAPPRPVIRGDGSPSAIPGSYLVKLKDTASVRGQGADQRARTLARAHRGTLGRVWRHAVHGFAATMTRDEALRLAAEPDVEFVQQDQQLANGDLPTTREAPKTAPPAPAFAQTPAPWGLDRIDQHALPLDNHYNYDDSAGEGVRAYILATGIAAGHPEFGGRASGGGNFVNDGRPSSSDCHGAGTRLGGIVGGAQNGVAKKVGLVAVRTSDCHNLTSTSAVVNGFDWVIEQAALPAIILFTVLDYCVDPQNGSPLPCAPDVAEIVVNAQESAFLAGIPVFGMAGDSAQDTCANATGAAPDTVYVGATTSGDARAGVSNFGPCVTMFAPGEGITTADPGGSTVVGGSGASAAYVAGAAALFAGKEEFAGASPDQIRDELVENRSTPGVVTGLSPNTPNRLLFTGPPGFYTNGDSASLTRSSDGRLALFGATKGGWIVHRAE